MNTFNIGGISVSGNNIEIRNGVVTVDGIVIDGVQTNGQKLEINVVSGVIQSLKADGSVTCGDVTGSVNAGGSVTADNVGGNASAGGSVTCDDVGGNASAGGSVTCGDVAGNVSAMTVRKN